MTGEQIEDARTRRGAEGKGQSKAPEEPNGRAPAWGHASADQPLRRGDEENGHGALHRDVDEPAENGQEGRDGSHGFSSSLCLRSRRERSSCRSSSERSMVSTRWTRAGVACPPNTRQTKERDSVASEGPA